MKTDVSNPYDHIGNEYILCTLQYIAWIFPFRIFNSLPKSNANQIILQKASHKFSATKAWTKTPYMLNLLAKRDDFYEFMQHTILIIDSAIKFIEKWIQR